MWGSITPSIDDICCFSGLVIVLSYSALACQSVLWTTPSPGTIKVNIDGSFTSSTVGTSGIFCYHEGKPLLYFTKHAHAKLAIHAEILTIR